jgi:hypothetical protein
MAHSARKTRALPFSAVLPASSFRTQWGPRNRSKIHARNAFAIHEALASNMPAFGLCKL